MTTKHILQSKFIFGGMSSWHIFDVYVFEMQHIYSIFSVFEMKNRSIENIPDFMTIVFYLQVRLRW